MKQYFVRITYTVAGKLHMSQPGMCILEDHTLTHGCIMPTITNDVLMLAESDTRCMSPSSATVAYSVSSRGSSPRRIMHRQCKLVNDSCLNRIVACSCGFLLPSYHCEDPAGAYSSGQRLRVISSSTFAPLRNENKASIFEFERQVHKDGVIYKLRPALLQLIKFKLQLAHATIHSSLFRACPPKSWKHARL